MQEAEREECRDVDQVAVEFAAWRGVGGYEGPVGIIGACRGSLARDFPDAGDLA